MVVKPTKWTVCSHTELKWGFCESLSLQICSQTTTIKRSTRGENVREVKDEDQRENADKLRQFFCALWQRGLAVKKRRGENHSRHLKRYACLVRDKCVLGKSGLSATLVCPERQPSFLQCKPGGQVGRICSSIVGGPCPCPLLNLFGYRMVFLISLPREPLGVIILEGCTVELAEEETEVMKIFS